MPLTPRNPLKPSPRTILPPRRIRPQNRLVHHIRRDHRLHIPDRLPRRARDVSHPAQLGLGDVRDAHHVEGDGEVDGEEEADVLVELGGLGVVEDELADDAEGDFFAVQEVVQAGEGGEAVVDLGGGLDGEVMR